MRIAGPAFWLILVLLTSVQLAQSATDDFVERAESWRWSSLRRVEREDPAFPILSTWPFDAPPIGCNLSTNRKRKPKWRRCVAASIAVGPSAILTGSRTRPSDWGWNRRFGPVEGRRNNHRPVTITCIIWILQIWWLSPFIFRIGRLMSALQLGPGDPDSARLERDPVEPAGVVEHGRQPPRGDVGADSFHHLDGSQRLTKGSERAGASLRSDHVAPGAELAPESTIAARASLLAQSIRRMLKVNGGLALRGRAYVAGRYSSITSLGPWLQPAWAKCQGRFNLGLGLILILIPVSFPPLLSSSSSSLKT